MGSILRTLRERAGLSVADAAEQIGVSRSLVYAWEKDEKQPEPPNLRAACRVYAASEAERAELAALRAFGGEAAP